MESETHHLTAEWEAAPQGRDDRPDPSDTPPATALSGLEPMPDNIVDGVKRGDGNTGRLHLEH